MNEKAATLVKQQSTETLMQSLAHLEEIAPEPDHAEMPEWCRMTEWIEEELIERLGCRDAHTDWVLSDDFGSNGERTSYAFLAGVAGYRGLRTATLSRLYIRSASRASGGSIGQWTKITRALAPGGRHMTLRSEAFIWSVTPSCVRMDRGAKLGLIRGAM